MRAKTVPSARIAPSLVEREAETMAKRHQAPSQWGACWVRRWRKALSSGSHSAQDGRPRSVEQESGLNWACTESGP